MFVSKEQATISLARAHHESQARRSAEAARSAARPSPATSVRSASRSTARFRRSSRTPCWRGFDFRWNGAGDGATPNPIIPYRNAFQRDRDRVVHARAFRRLEAKTQVFTPGLSDHFRNRLTHTIEVAQIARTVAAVLGLDEDLTEALALAHDIGHPPFAHAGKRR